MELLVAATDQADITVEVHRLVGLMGEVHVTFALEACDFYREQRDEAAIFVIDSGGLCRC